MSARFRRSRVLPRAVLRPIVARLIVLVFLSCSFVAAQSDRAGISGRIADQSGAVLVAARVDITDVENGVGVSTLTSDDGVYVLTNLRPGPYRMTVQKEGFRTIVLSDLVLNVQDALSRNFTMQVGIASETITVTAGRDEQNMSAAISTVVDSQFVQNMPLNGRSFQSLFYVSPGVIVATWATFDNPGQFSVNGQRTDANYFTIDGVSANFGVDAMTLGQNMGGTLPGFTALGGTNSLVSVDSMREFRILTSSYAPEYGRMPGAQISIVTKSGTNAWHGSASDYLRNDVFDARNYFDYKNPNNPSGADPLAKPALRQNDFGGTFSGPIWKDRTFFFVSYEGLRLLQPVVNSAYFPTSSEKANFTGGWAAIANATPTGPVALANKSNLYTTRCGPTNSVPGQTIAPDDPNYSPCETLLNAPQSNPSSFNAYSIRVDHSLTNRISLFGRYNHTPSHQGAWYYNNLTDIVGNNDTVTAGVTAAISPTMVNDFRINWSRSYATYDSTLSNSFGATIPAESQVYPPGFSPKKNQQYFLVVPNNGVGFGFALGRLGGNSLRQWNSVDTLSKAVGAHQLKIGADWRRISPSSHPISGDGLFPSFGAAVHGEVDLLLQVASDPITARLDNWSLFGQDTWKATSRLTLTYGLRWEINTPPVSETSGKPLYNMSGIYDSYPVALVTGPLWNTRYTNLAPRVGAAYQLTPKTVLRGGFGLFYDLGYGGDLSGVMGNGFPYTQDFFNYYFNGGSEISFNLSLPAYQLPPLSTILGPNTLHTNAVDPHLRVPVTYQWNAAFERQLGSTQTITATYVGAYGSDLLRADYVIQPVGAVDVTHNGAYSHYNALQVKFMRRMSGGLQALISYSLAKTLDTESADTAGDTGVNGVVAASVSQLVLPPLTPANFDIRHNLSAAISYDIPETKWGGKLGSAVLNGWALDGAYKLQSGPPIDVRMYMQDPALGGPFVTGLYLRPARVPGQPTWIPDATEPSGQALNPAAFRAPTDFTSTVGLRNNIRSPYGIDQIDLAVRRRFNITERVKLDFRAEFFNVLNHPMFGFNLNTSFWASCFHFPCTSAEVWPSFGKVGPGAVGKLQTLNQLPSSWGTRLSPLYAFGGNRSGQLALKLSF